MTVSTETPGFESLGLGPEVLRAVADAGYTAPTPIQAQAIPQILRNRDVLGCAQTGTGKTASFTLPMIDVLGRGRARARMPRSLILAPTRELAAQVAENFEVYGRYHNLGMALLIGGVSFTDQQRRIDRGVDVLIATPGRLLDHHGRGGLILNSAQIVVIDEADRMLDMGFIPDVERILALTPPPHQRQTVMFSATMPPEIKRLASRFLHNPREIVVDPPSSAAETVDQALLRVTPRTKPGRLRRWLDAPDFRNGLVFCNRKRDVAQLYTSLLRRGYKAGALHGDMDQHKRMEWLEKFRQGEVAVLVCSDVAARGLDIPRVSHVFNYDVPLHAEDYIHRIGRTGRAGESGVARTLALPDDEERLAAIESMLGKSIPVLEGDGAARPSELKKSESKQSKSKRSEPKPSAPAPSAAPAEAAPAEAAPAQEPRAAVDGAGEEKPRKRTRRRRGGSARQDGARPAEDQARPQTQTRTASPKRSGADRPFGESEDVPAFLRR